MTSSTRRVCGPCVVLLLAAAARSTDMIGIQIVEREAFPVFDDPKIVPATEAEALGFVLPRDMVIGIARGREAKAYPISIMGVHELGNGSSALMVVTAVRSRG